MKKTSSERSEPKSGWLGGIFFCSRTSMGNLFHIDNNLSNKKKPKLVSLIKNHTYLTFK